MAQPVPSVCFPVAILSYAAFPLDVHILVQMLHLLAVRRDETRLVCAVLQAMDMIADVGADNMLVHIDTYHCNIVCPPPIAPQ